MEAVFYSAGHTEALSYACAFLKEKGYPFAITPDRTVTHLLLDVPFKEQVGLDQILSQLSKDVTIFGGNLQQPILAGRKVFDLLKDPVYLAENANITAHCAMKLALSQLPVTLQNCPVLIVGWGRIGKCLAQLLKQTGACVSVAARKPQDRAMLTALGYIALDTNDLDSALANYRVIFNTVPVLLLKENALSHCGPNCIKYELASLPGMEGSDIISARGLPSRFAPESSGDLIARSILRLG